MIILHTLSSQAALKETLYHVMVLFQGFAGRGRHWWEGGWKVADCFGWLVQQELGASPGHRSSLFLGDCSWGPSGFLRAPSFWVLPEQIVLGPLFPLYMWLSKDSCPVQFTGWGWVLWVMLWVPLESSSSLVPSQVRVGWGLVTLAVHNQDKLLALYLSPSYGRIRPTILWDK